MQYINRTIESFDWVTLILVGSIIILALLKLFYPKRFDDFIKLPVSNNYFLTKGKSEEIRHPFSIIFFLIQLISISLFIFLFFLEKGETDYLLFVQIIAATFVFILAKVSIEKLIGAIFSIENVIDKYIYEKLTYRNFISLLLITLNFIFYFSIKPTLNTLVIFTGIILFLNILVLYYSYKNYRSLIFSNFFYFLLYLCALEISPYLILYKAIV